MTITRKNLSDILICVQVIYFHFLISLYIMVYFRLGIPGILPKILPKLWEAVFGNLHEFSKWPPKVVFFLTVACFFRGCVLEMVVEWIIQHKS